MNQGDRDCGKSPAYSARFYLFWQILLLALFSALAAFMLFGDWYTHWINSRAHPRLAHTLCVLSVIVVFNALLFLLSRKRQQARRSVPRGNGV